MDWLALLFSMLAIISFALYSKKACSLTKPFDAGSVVRIQTLLSGLSLFVGATPFFRFTRVAKTNNRLRRPIGL
jgi:hypothetical protein